MQPLKRQQSSLFLILLLVWIVGTRLEAAPIDANGWLAVRSPNFVLYTHAEPERGVEIVQGLERFRSMFARLAPSLELRSPTPTKLFAFRDAHAYAGYKRGPSGGSVQVLGQFVRQFDVNYITLDASALQRGALGVIQHEYVHYFVRHNFPRVPLWFNEGLAEYYSTFEIEGEHARLGRPVEDHWRRLREAELDLGRVLNAHRGSSDYHEASRVGTFYATSWALVHYLLASGERLDQTAEYLVRLGQGEDPERAFEAAFGDRLSRFEDQLREYLNGPSLAEIRVPLERLGGEAPVTVHELPRAEALYQLGDLLAHIGFFDDAQDHFQQTLDLQPNHPGTVAGLAWIRDAQKRHAEAAMLHEEALASGAAEPQQFLAYGRHLLIRQNEAVAAGEYGAPLVERAIGALEASIRAFPDYGEAHVLIGQAYLLRPDSRDGVKYLQRARTLLPDRDEVLLLLVRMHLKNAEIDAAETVLETELAFRAEPHVVEEIRQEVERWRYLHAAEAAFGDGEIERGLELFDQAISITSDPLLRERMEERLQQLQERFER